MVVKADPFAGVSSPGIEKTVPQDGFVGLNGGMLLGRPNNCPQGDLTPAWGCGRIRARAVEVIERLHLPDVRGNEIG